MSAVTPSIIILFIILFLYSVYQSTNWPSPCKSEQFVCKINTHKIKKHFRDIFDNGPNCNFHFSFYLFTLTCVYVLSNTICQSCSRWLGIQWRNKQIWPVHAWYLHFYREDRINLKFLMKIAHPKTPGGNSRTGTVVSTQIDRHPIS